MADLETLRRMTLKLPSNGAGAKLGWASWVELDEARCGGYIKL